MLVLLENGPLSKAKLSTRMGHKEISGQLNKVMRLLLGDQNVEQTIPGKPNSRLQKYRLTTKGAAHLVRLRETGKGMIDKQDRTTVPIVQFSSISYCAPSHDMALSNKSCGTLA